MALYTDQNYGTKSNTKSTDRILVLKVIDGKAPLDSLGLVDKRLFSGGNRLHGIMEPNSTLWYFKYDDGALPQQLRDQKFTSFQKLVYFAKEYFKKRNVEISEIIE